MIYGKTSEHYILKQEYTLSSDMIIVSLKIINIIGQFGFLIIIYLFKIYTLNVLEPTERTRNCSE